MKGNPNINPCIDCDVLVAEGGSPALMHCLRARHNFMTSPHACSATMRNLLYATSISEKRSVQQRTCQR